MNGNFNPQIGGHDFFNTSITNARFLQTTRLRTKEITKFGNDDEPIKVNDKIVFHDDLIIMKDNKEYNIKDLFDKIERIETYIKLLDKGLDVNTFNDDGNMINIKY